MRVFKVFWGVFSGSWGLCLRLEGWVFELAACGLKLFGF